MTVRYAIYWLWSTIEAQKPANLGSGSRHRDAATVPARRETVIDRPTPWKQGEEDEHVERNWSRRSQNEERKNSGP